MPPACESSLCVSSALNASSFFTDRIKEYHLGLLRSENGESPADEICLAPIIASSALRGLENRFSPKKGEIPLQFGFIAGMREPPYLEKKNDFDGNGAANNDPRLLFNVTAPSSTFICGSQGSGKSHTLSCILEACLIKSKLGKLENPLTSIVFHYDTFISDSCGSPCEAAYLASDPAVSVRVLCAPTNIASIKKTYRRLNIPVESLKIDQKHLNTKRMMELMAVGRGDTPLYMETVKRILREMRLLQQQNGGGFDYKDFKKKVDGSGLTPAQMGPLTQRLEVLESFMPKCQTISVKKAKNSSLDGGTDWEPVRGQLTIVDLSCPCITPETACALFNICLGLFIEQDPDIGRVVALDEAHKYMGDSPEASVFTDTILSIVRLQRHLAARVVVSTQEPTISPSLLSLCSVTIVHRFTSPEWLRILQHHLAAAAKDRVLSKGKLSPEGDKASSLFDQIVRLKVGEALLFAPSAIIGVDSVDSNELEFMRLGEESMPIMVRGRLTCDGGKSVLST